MSAPMEDLMGNPVAEHTFDSSDDSDVEIAVVDDRPEDDQVEPRVSFDDDDVSYKEVEGIVDNLKRLVVEPRNALKN